MKHDYTMDDFHSEMRGVHPLHSVKVRASSTLRGHLPLIAADRTRIVGCTCGWRTPSGTTDSDDTYVAHATVMR